MTQGSTESTEFIEVTPDPQVRAVILAAAGLPDLTDEGTVSGGWLDAADALTLTATLAGTGAMCSGHRDEIPAIATEDGPYVPAYADGDGWLWCLACAKHMAACDDADCAHPRAVFAGAVPA